MDLLTVDRCAFPYMACDALAHWLECNHSNKAAKSSSPNISINFDLQFTDLCSVCSRHSNMASKNFKFRLKQALNLLRL